MSDFEAAARELVVDNFDGRPRSECYRRDREGVYIRGALMGRRLARGRG
jgi:hypothetical protein